MFSPEFLKFQRIYILVYLIMMAADWLQGPYVYALYKYYGYDISDIGLLFIIGFGSSMIFGTLVGSAADKYGRKKLCLVFGLLYSLSCMTKHIKDFRVLLVGRLLGGISTSILFSSFESWMVTEHHAAKYPEEWLGLTFSICTTGNGLVAIGSGVVASVVREQFGPVAPFDVSLLCLITGSIVVALYWGENTGDASIDMSNTLGNAFTKLRQDPKIIYLGIIQSFFEGAMYIFVFMWTPALESTSPWTGQLISHGWIFACFMVSTRVGYLCFSKDFTVRARHSILMLDPACFLLSSDLRVDWFHCLPIFPRAFLPRGADHPLDDRHQRRLPDRSGVLSESHRAPRCVHGVRGVRGTVLAESGLPPKQVCAGGLSRDDDELLPYAAQPHRRAGPGQHRQLDQPAGVHALLLGADAGRCCVNSSCCESSSASISPAVEPPAPRTGRSHRTRRSNFNHPHHDCTRVQGRHWEARRWRKEPASSVC